MGREFADEINPSSASTGGYRRGISRWRTRSDTNGSQFFIMHSDYRLPPNYVIFAKGDEGLEVVDALVDTPTTRGRTARKSKPLTPPVIKKVTIRP